MGWWAPLERGGVRDDIEARLRRRLWLEWGLAPTRPVILAFSGGRDSTALFWALHAIGQDFVAAHVDHGWHPRSAEWAARCAEVAASAGVPFVLRQLGKDLCGEGPEDVARRGRYAALQSLLGPGQFLLTAQHRDDQAETFLLQALRGAGAAGLAAMPWRRPLGSGVLARPLLDCSGQTLQGYLHRRGLQWIEDPANRDPRFARSRVRRQLIPALVRLGWSDPATPIARSAANLADTLQVEADWFRRIWRDYCRAYPEKGAEPRLSLAFLRTLPESLHRVFLRQYLRHRRLSPPNHEDLQTLLARTAQPAHGQRLAWPGVEAWVQGGWLWLWPADLHWGEGGPQGTWWPQAPEGVGSGFAWSFGGEAPAATRLHRLDPAVLARPLRWERPQPGMRYVDAAGHHRPLKKLLLEAGVPPFLRPQLPLLWDARDRLLLMLGFPRDKGLGETADGPLRLWPKPNDQWDFSLKFEEPGLGVR